MARIDPDKIVVCSFHTADDYYRAFGEKQRRSLEALGLPFEIAEIEKKDGEEWLDICRKKVPFIHSVCQKHPDKKVFWIDVDCELEFLPDFVLHSTADIIGFQRGFDDPFNIGYKKRARFWEPCFWGIHTTEAARRYIAAAAESEKKAEVRATDDYFFEEAWRLHAASMTFQIIPSQLVAGRKDNLATGVRPFFYFGSSGNVDKFKGQAAQHRRAGIGRFSLMGAGDFVRRTSLAAAKAVQDGLPDQLSLKMRRLSDNSGLTGLLVGDGKTTRAMNPELLRSYWALVAAARAGDKAETERLLALVDGKQLPGDQHVTFEAAARALLDYATSGDGPPLRLAWWDRPFPGNFGDWLSPLIIGGISGRRVVHEAPTKLSGEPHLFGIGSIGRFISRKSVVVGTGISQRDVALHPKANYISVRGPITAQKLREEGGEVEDRFGDPGILISRLIPVTRDKTNGKIALVRHHTHRKLAARLPENMDELSVMVGSRAGITDLVEALNRYDSVVTSAMHIYIACQSYGIPVALVNFQGGESAVHGDGIKYVDYALGAGVPERTPIVIDPDMRSTDFAPLTYEARISSAKMDDVEEAVREGIRRLDAI
ncbi:MAG: hypothetical protein R3D84_00230 [Paracoccaceae bacterium]